MKLTQFLLLVIFIITFGIPVLLTSAQTAATGALIGTVTDTSGAVVQQAEVEVASESTGAIRKAITAPNGVYRVPLLSPGSYRVQAISTGFKLAVRSAVPVRVTETTTLDIELQPGARTDVVNVEGTPQMIQTDSSTRGRVTDERSVKNLPLVTRNFTQIIGLSPGVSVGLTDATELGTGSTGMGNYNNADLSVNGARGYDNNFQMDGTGVSNLVGEWAYGGGVAIPNPDTIAEFKVLTGQYDASYGRNAGANVNVVTKSGSNQFHGDLFEFFRNEDLNANSFFFNADDVPRGILRQNQYGGTLGGPIKKDQLLFFSSYQGTQQLNGVASGCSITFVGPPLTNDRSAGALGALYGGQSGALGGVAVAPDGSNINPVALKLLNLKLPNGNYVVPTPQRIADGGGQYGFSNPCSFREDQFLTNFDFLQSAKSKFAAKFFFSNQNETQTLPQGNVPGSPASIVPHYRNLSSTYDYVFSPNVLNQVEFGYHQISEPTAWTPSFTFPAIGSSVIPQSQGIGYLFIGPEFVGGYYDSFLSTNVLALQDTLTSTLGRHNMRFGAGVTRTGMVFNWLQGSGLTFLSMPDLLLGQSAAQNGSPFSNVYESGDIPGQLDRNYIVWNPWAYVQDDLRVSSRLTLNLGFRYERLGGFADTNGRNSSFNIALADPNPPASGSQAGYVLPSNYPGTVVIPPGSVRVNNKLAINGNGQNTIGPRVGFAWQALPNSNRFVLRGGYGIYYSTFVGQQWFQNAFTPPWADERFSQGTANAAATWAAPFGQLYSPSDFPMFPSYSPSTNLSFVFPSVDARPPITQQYSLNLQTRVATDYLLEIGYVGTRATHLLETVTLNQGDWATPSDPIRGQTSNTLVNLPLRVPIEGFNPIGLQSVQTTGNAWYNALQVSLTKRFSHGLQFLASYTYARLFDTEGGQTAATGSGNTLVTGNQDSPKARYGPASLVRPHRFVVSLVYELPNVVGTGFAGSILSNWSVSGVATILSGHPLTIVSTNANNVFGINGYGGDLAEWSPSCTKSQLGTRGSVERKINDYFDNACIGAYPIIGADSLATGFGNMGVGIINGPGMSNVDLALTKRIPVNWFRRESNWEFRAEAFNAFNTPHFSDPDTNVSDGAAFGVISATVANPRVLQLALKYNF